MTRQVNNNSLISVIRSAGFARLLSGLLMVATGALPFFASWHEASVQHVACAEHGELVHVSSPHDHEDTHTRDTASLQSEENSSPSDEHQHCDIAFVVQGRAGGPQVPASIRFSPPSVMPPPVDVRSAWPGRESVLASAPKTSPPII